MAREKKKVPLDRPEMINVRERMKPFDFSIVLAKQSDGSLVEVRHNAEPLVKGGVIERGPGGRPVLTCYHPWTEPVDYEALKSLKTGVAEKFVFRWCYRHGQNMVAIQRSRWEPVLKSDNQVICPGAYGDETDDYIHHGDLILHKRLRSYQEQVRKEEEYYQNTDRILADSSAAIEEDLNTVMSKAGSKARVKDVKQEFTVEEDEAVTRIASE